MLSQVQLHAGDTQDMGFATEEKKVLVKSLDSVLLKSHMSSVVLT